MILFEITVPPAVESVKMAVDAPAAPEPPLIEELPVIVASAEVVRYMPVIQLSTTPSTMTA